MLGNGIGLPLERAAGMNDQMNVYRQQNRLEIGAHGIAAPTFADLARTALQLVEFALQLARIAA